MRYGWLGLLWLSLTLGVLAQPIEKIPNPRATYGGWVVDMAGVLNAQQKAEINALISELERETGAEIAVVIIRKTQGATPKEYATELFNKWGVGKRELDNGVLMLVALQDRRVEIETDYGMESVLPDGLVGAILDEAVIPEFRRGKYAQGILAGVERIAQEIRHAQQTGAYETPTRPYDTPQSHKGPSSFPLGVPTAVVAVLLLGMGAFLWAGVTLFDRPPRCPRCQKKMRLLDEQADDAFLNALQLTEERLRSVNYLVWRCEECDTVEIIPKVSWFTPYSKCPKCGGYTVLTNTHVVRRPTYMRTGLAIERQQCKNLQCRHKRETERILPKRPRNDEWQIGSGVILGGGWDGGGSIGGGGFSGGGSFGGGSSGGGGAGRSW